MLNHHDGLVASVERRCRPVLSHGEPHRGNVIVTAGGPVLIDWDTVRSGPAERDLWSLIAADPSLRPFYEDLTGRVVDDDALRLFDLSWDLCEIALFVHEFRRPHEHIDDTETAWRGLVEQLDPERWVDVV